MQKQRLEREGENPVPHYWEHVLWVWGYDDVDTFIEAAEAFNLNGVVEQITVPVPDHPRRERPPDHRRRTPTSPTTRRVNSPKRELRIFTPEEGATEHVGLDHLPHVGAYTADWIEDTFAELA